MTSESVRAGGQPDARAAGPITPGERLPILDALRGLAIFGILLVNIFFFSAPLYLPMAGMEWGSGPLDKAAELVVRFLVQGKFYSLFSFLFGLGFAIQLERAEARGARFVPLYRRRLLALLLIGLVHAYLIWMGDILTVYALLGFLLFFFRRRQPRTILIWALALLFIPVLFAAGMVASSGSSEGGGPFGSPEHYRILVELSHQAYGEGTLGEIMAQRAQDAVFVTMGGLFQSPQIFAMFLFGAYFGRRRLFHDLPQHLGLYGKIWRWGLVLGVAGNLVFTVVNEFVNPMAPSGLFVVGAAAYAFGAPALCFFYISSFVLLFQRPSWRARLGQLKPVGRAALSNYLLQSIVCTTIFYSYGLALYGKAGPALGVGLAVVIFALQIPLSRWWLRRFRFGPAEWFWRSLTYGKRQPLRAPAWAEGRATPAA